MKTIKQKGQAIVEFALIVPLFCLFMFGIFYAGMFAVDYVTLNNIAFVETRKAVIAHAGDSGKYSDVVKRKSDGVLLLNGWYDFGGKDNIDVTVNKPENGDTMTATITAEVDKNTSILLRTILPEKITIRSSMYSG